MRVCEYVVCEFVFVRARVCKSVQECARMCKSVQECARVCKNVQECARVCKGVIDCGLPCHPKWQRSIWISIHFPLHVWLCDVLHKVYTYIFCPKDVLKQSAIWSAFKRSLLVT